MFYFKITTTKRWRRGEKETITRHVEVREFVRRPDLGEYVVSQTHDNPEKIVVEKMTQKDYKAAVAARKR
jgi:hypothetical protein